jgi:hypothetical protein
MPTGTHDLAWLRANRLPIREYGLDNLQEVLERDLAIHNAQMNDAMSLLAEITTDKERVTGGNSTTAMFKIDERGRARTQRVKQGVTVGFPLERVQHALGWTADWLRNATTFDIAEGQVAARKAHRLALMADIKRAFFIPTNYTFTDYMTKQNVDLGVKRLVNADSMPIPTGVDGQSFDAATHTHYLARVGGSLAASDVTALINTVMEHGHSESVKIFINVLDETTWRALSGFMAYQDPRIERVTDGSLGQRLDITRTNNRPIGVIGAAEVWVKPWAIQNYAVCTDINGPKPLAMRESTIGPRGLYLESTILIAPLQAEYANADYGLGVWNRTNGAVLYYGGTSYTAPTITTPRE